MSEDQGYSEEEIRRMLASRRYAELSGYEISRIAQILQLNILKQLTRIADVLDYVQADGALSIRGSVLTHERKAGVSGFG